jgi:pimeloyl-ACP methyl ester carboxylesterase
MKFSPAVAVLIGCVAAVAGLTGCHDKPSEATVVVPKSHFVKLATPPQKNDKLVVFVHGILGDMDNTWANTATNSSWPKLIAQDPEMADYDVFVYGYYTPRMGHAADIDQTATLMAQQMIDAGFFDNYREIDFITHSMGGIITKRALNQFNNPMDFARLEEVRAVVYISVPSSGAPIADIASWFSHNPQFSSMSASESNNYLQSIDGDWRKVMNQRTSEHPFPKAFVTYEILPTDGVQVVPALYTSQLSDSDIVGFSYNHIDIVKPDSQANDVYVWTRARILGASRIQPQTSVTNGPRPVAVSGGAAVGTLYQYTFTSPDGATCNGEIVKISKTEWYERHVPTDPAPCLRDSQILPYTEVASDDPNYFMLYDSGRKLFTRLSNTAVGDQSPQEWRLESSKDWNSVHTLTRKK